MRATCRADAELPFTATGRRFSPFIKFEIPSGPRRKLPQPWERRGGSFFQIGDDLGDHMIELIGGFGLRDPGLLRQSSCQILFLHFGFMLAGLTQIQRIRGRF